MIFTTRSSSTRPPHSGHEHVSIEPCTSITFFDPARRCRRSMFCVITPSIRPRRSSSASASCAPFGTLSPSAAKRSE
jgi:hypothetical protein